MKTLRWLMVATSVGLLLPPAASCADAVCGKEPPVYPIHCVCGKLIDQSGAPVSGALVRVSRDGAEVASGGTGADGKFLFRELKAGSYELAANFEGLRPFHSQIVLTKPEKSCRRELVIVMVLSYPDNCGSYVMKR